MEGLILFQSNIYGSVVGEVKTFKYFHASVTLAEFEVLMFEDDQIGTQGKIIKTEEIFSPGKIYRKEEFDLAVQDMIDLIENKVKEDETILKTKKYLKFEK